MPEPYPCDLSDAEFAAQRNRAVKFPLYAINPPIRTAALVLSVTGTR
jgi:hypothetical protein